MATPLTQSDQSVRPTHFRFVGGTIYCSVLGHRLNLGPDHRYGQAFTCPHCGTTVSSRES